MGNKLGGYVGITARKPGRTGEKYIWLNSHGRFTVVITIHNSGGKRNFYQKRFGSWEFLDEAVQARDKWLTEFAL